MTAPATGAFFDRDREHRRMTWAELFDATADLDVTVADVREALREHREGDDA